MVASRARRRLERIPGILEKQLVFLRPRERQGEKTEQEAGAWSHDHRQEDALSWEKVEERKPLSRLRSEICEVDEDGAGLQVGVVSSREGRARSERGEESGGGMPRTRAARVGERGSIRGRGGK